MLYMDIERGQEPPVEARVWQAVITSTINEWLSGTLRQRQEAEQYLFHDNRDFPEVCASAGMQSDVLRARLAKHRVKIAKGAAPALAA